MAWHHSNQLFLWSSGLVLLARPALDDPIGEERNPYSWQEEQLLSLHGYRGEAKAEELHRLSDDSEVQRLLQTVNTDHLNWLASLQFGLIELDCGLIHGSSADVGDELDETTSPLILLDRLTRLDVNRLFTARSGRQFRLQLTGGQIRSRVKDHTREQLHEQPVPRRSVIGVGSGADYTLFDPASDHIQFRSVHDQLRAR
ncbi:phosphoesterase [Synechococcus sp. MIT S9509]|uniref:phosphoesterase n=1 Tax=Synechococcus sp. MIT S9509 TaxID=1801630 RepID=UPI0012E7B68C|nr:phosphoesterase [Synechococcus sp. MIT S9509]